MQLKKIWLLSTPLLIATVTGSHLSPVVGSEIIDYSGDVQIISQEEFGLSQEEPSSQSVQKGMDVNLGDLLITGPNAWVQIQCDRSNRIWTMHSNLRRGIASGCPQRRGPIRLGRQNDTTPGGNDSSVPYVISPRGGTVLNSLFTVQWNPVPDAMCYTVQIAAQSMERPIWEADVCNTSVEYPGTPALLEAEHYFIIVESDTGQSSQFDEGAGTEEYFFELLTSYEIEDVQGAIATIDNLGLPTENQAFALAQIYIDEALYVDAIHTLEQLVTANDNSILAYQILGDLYRKVGLNLLAESRYEQAIALASIEGNIEAQAQAQAGLVEVKIMLGQTDAAIELLEQAQIAYEILQDTERAEELKQRLNALSS